ncbi:MAG: hypothetical protein ACYCVD_02745 [Desulfitobacteriaceae bacterium]
MNTQEDFDAIPNEEMDAHVAKTTQFDSWEEMMSEAVKNYTAKQLGL